MGMPRWPERFHDFAQWTWSMSGLKIMARSDPLTEADWLAIVSARAEQVRRYLDSMTLETLGDVKCLLTSSSHHSIGDNSPTVLSESGFSLQNQGIFATSYLSRRYRIGSTYTERPRGIDHPDGYVYVWGLARKSGAWVLAKVEWIGEPGYKERGYERAHTVTVNEASIPEITKTAQVTPQEIWTHLGQVIIDWMIRRYQLYEEARVLATAVVGEEQALRELNENTLPVEFFWYCNTCKIRGSHKRKRGGPVPNGATDDSQIMWAHNQTSPKCPERMVSTSTDLSEFSTEEQLRIGKFREVKESGIQ